MARTGSRTYDPQTGKWTRNNDGGGSSSKSNSNSGSSRGSKSNSGGGSGKSNLTSKSSDKKHSSGKTEKKYNNIELRTLQGTLNFIVTEQTIKLKAGDTVKLQGLGKFLSGNYYVKDITRQISTNGYAHSATLIKTDFGKSLKSSTKSSKKKGSSSKKSSTKKKTTKKETSPKTKSNATKTYTVKKGDCPYSIAKRFYGNGNQWKKLIVEKTGKPIPNPKKLQIGTKLIIK